MKGTGVQLPTTQEQGQRGAGYCGRWDSVWGYVDQQIRHSPPPPPPHPQVVDNRMENSAFLQLDWKDMPSSLVWSPLWCLCYYTEGLHCCNPKLRQVFCFYQILFRPIDAFYCVFIMITSTLYWPMLCILFLCFYIHKQKSYQYW